MRPPRPPLMGGSDRLGPWEYCGMPGAGKISRQPLGRTRNEGAPPRLTRKRVAFLEGATKKGNIFGRSLTAGDSSITVETKLIWGFIKDSLSSVC